MRSENQGIDKKKSSRGGRRRAAIHFKLVAALHRPPGVRASEGKQCVRPRLFAEALARRLAHDESENGTPRPQNRQIAPCRSAAPEAGGQYAALRSTFL
jgi:hypothetical protein